MRIGLDAHILGKNKGGVERYVRHLVSLLPTVAARHEYYFFVTARYKRQVQDGPNTHFIALPIDDPVFQRSLILPWLARRYRLDVLHVQRICPPTPGCAMVLSIHDLLPLTAPADHPGFRNGLVRLLTPASMKHAQRILTVSETVRREIIRRGHVPAENVVAIYNGLDHGCFRPQPAVGLDDLGIDGLADPYVLFIGALEPRKNLETAIEGFSRWVTRTERRVRLVIAGAERRRGYLQKLTALVNRLDLDDRVLFTGYVPEAVNIKLLQRAGIYLAPSSGEGFNLPALEAMACGAPVVCSDIAVHRELFAKAAALFRPRHPEDLSVALERLWADQAERERLKTAGFRLAARFTWENTVCRTAAIYEETGSGIRA